jgi:hypothetical protein
VSICFAACAEARFLGRVDEFDQAEASDETDDSSKISFRLFAAKRDPFEAFEASEALLDA